MWGKEKLFTSRDSDSPKKLVHPLNYIALYNKVVIFELVIILCVIVSAYLFNTGLEFLNLKRQVISLLLSLLEKFMLFITGTLFLFIETIDLLQLSLQGFVLLG